MSDSFVTVAAFQDPVAAVLAKNFLESEGIPAVLFDETTVATDWMLSAAIGGVKLQVAPIHLERAEMLLMQVKKNRDENDDEDETPAEHTAIATQEIAEELRSEREDRDPVNQLVDRLFRVVVLGLLFWPLQFYALWLLLQLTHEPGKVSAGRRWKVWVCVLLNLPLLALIFFVCYIIFGVLVPG